MEFNINRERFSKNEIELKKLLEKEISIDKDSLIILENLYSLLK